MQDPTDVNVTNDLINKPIQLLVFPDKKEKSSTGRMFLANGALEDEET